MGVVVRLLDARTGSCTEIRPFRRGIVRLCAHVAESRSGLGVGTVRVLLTADVLSRVVEMGGAQALTAFSFSCWSPQQALAVEQCVHALGMHPPATGVSSRDVHTTPDGPIDVHILPLGSPADSQDGLLLPVAGAQVAGDHGNGTSVQELTALDDPLALRLALLSVPFGWQAELTKAALIEATSTLASLRRSVAEWAESRSAPVPAQVAASMRAAFDDLDCATVVALLGSLAADTTLPAGASFETAAFADRVLGLELTREIGRPRR